MSSEAEVGTQLVSRRSIRRLGRYVLIEELAKGGMAQLYVAWREGTSEICVLKQLLPDLATDPVASRRFEREAMVAAQLDHPNIARTVESGVESGVRCIASELIQGITLNRVLERVTGQGGRMPVKIAVGIAIGILEGLSYAHGLQDGEGTPLEIVHRDLSPQNVLVGFGGEVKLIDFGVARGRVDEFKTAPGVVVGSLEYLSPEQALSEEVDGRSDLYTVAVLLYEMLSGRAVVRDEKLMDLLASIVRVEPPPLSTRVKDLPPWLERAVHRGLRKERDQRWQTAAEFIAGLRPAGFTPANRREIAAFMRNHCAEDEQAMKALVARAHEALSLGPPPDDQGEDDLNAETAVMARDGSDRPLRRPSSAAVTGAPATFNDPNDITDPVNTALVPGQRFRRDAASGPQVVPVITDDLVSPQGQVPEGAAFVLQVQRPPLRLAPFVWAVVAVALMVLGAVIASWWPSRGDSTTTLVARSEAGPVEPGAPPPSGPTAYQSAPRARPEAAPRARGPESAPAERSDNASRKSHRARREVAESRRPESVPERPVERRVEQPERMRIDELLDKLRENPKDAVSLVAAQDLLKDQARHLPDSPRKRVIDVNLSLSTEEGLRKAWEDIKHEQAEKR